MFKKGMCVFNELRKKYNNFENFYNPNEIEEIAYVVMKQFNLYECPTPIATILDKAGFYFYIEDLPENMSGIIAVSDHLIELHGNKRIIKVNKDDNRSHQRFTMAHELGHYIFDYTGEGKYIDAYDITEEKVDTPKEMRVNRFATALLMPQDKFRDKYQAYTILKFKKEKILTLLADCFDVSETAIAKRIIELGLE